MFITGVCREGLFVALVFTLVSACSPFLGNAPIQTSVAETVEASFQMTAVVQKAKQEVIRELTTTAGPQRGGEGNVDSTNAPSPTFTETTTATPTASPTSTSTATYTPSPTQTPTSTKEPTLTPTWGPRYEVLDDWCLTHQGCATMEILNKTGTLATIKIQSDKFGVNVSFNVQPGNTIMELRPGRYYYYFSYCGKTSDGYHALNDNWYVIFKCN